MNKRKTHAVRKEWHRAVYKMPTKETQYFKSSEWRKLRTAVLSRDGYACCRCGDGRKRGLNAHHIIPRDEKGENHISNLLTLCSRCHDIIEADGTLKTRQAIEASGPYGKPIIGVATELDLDANRPSWHAWVYGGQSHPGYDSSEYKGS